MKKVFAFVSLMLFPALLWAKDYTISSPSGELSAIVKVDSTTSLSVTAKGHMIMENCIRAAIRSCIWHMSVRT